MINEELLNYVNQQLKQGVSREEIRSILASHGWRKEDIDEALSLLASAPKNNSFSAPSPVNPSSTAALSPLTTLPRASDLLKQAWNIYKQNFKKLIGITFILPIILAAVASVIVFALISLAGSSNGSFLKNFPLGFYGTSTAVVVAFIVLLCLLIFAAIIVQLVAQVALLYAIKERNQGIGIKEAYKKAWHKTHSYLWVSFLGGLAAFLGYIFFIIPGIILWVWFSLAIVIVVAEELKGTEAVLKSKEYVRGMWWAVFGRLVFLSVIFFVISFVVNIIFAIIFNIIGIPELSNITNTIVNFFLIPLMFAYFYVLYENLKSIKGNIIFAPSQKQKSALVFAAIVGGLIIPIIIGGIMFLVFSSTRCMKSPTLCNEKLENNYTVPEQPDFDFDFDSIDTLPVE